MEMPKISGGNGQPSHNTCKINSREWKNNSYVQARLNAKMLHAFAGYDRLEG